MADGAKGTVGQMVQDVGEVVAKPLSDEVGKAIEQGVQSVVSGPKPFNPAQERQKKEQEQKKLAEARRKIAWWKNLDEAQDRVRAEARQKKSQRLEQEQQQKRVKQYEVVQQKKENIALHQAQRRTEIRKGING